MVSFFLFLTAAWMLAQQLDEAGTIAAESARIADILEGRKSVKKPRILMAQVAPVEVAVPAIPPLDVPAVPPVETPKNADTVDALAKEALGAAEKKAADPAMPVAEGVGAPAVEQPANAPVPMPEVPVVPALPVEPAPAVPAAPAEPVAMPAAPVEPVPAVPAEPVAMPALPVEPAPAAPAVPAEPVAMPATPVEPVPAVPAEPVAMPALPVEPAPAAPAMPAAPVEPVPAVMPAAPAEPAPAVAGEKPAEKPVVKPADDLDKLISEATQETAGAKAVKPAEVLKAPAAVKTVEPKTVKGKPKSTLAHLDDASADMMANEELRRKAMDSHARDSMDEAERMMNARQFERAIGYFQEALNNFRGVDAEPKRKTAQRGIYTAYYKWAESLERQGNYTNAYDRASMASQLGHPRADALSAELKKKMAPDYKPPQEPTPHVSVLKQPEMTTKEKSVSELMRDAREYMQAREYDKAQLRLEAVLKQDPYNTEAIRLLQKTTQKKYDTATMELSATRNDIMAETRKTWNPRDYALITEQSKTPGWRGEKKRTEDKRQKILDKMAGIMIPNIDFRQANIYDVIEFLRKNSEEFDRPTDPDERKGVNIILNLGSANKADGAMGLDAGGAAAAPLDPFAPAPAAGAAPGLGAAAGDIPLVTFSANGISLLEALKIVTNVTKLKFRIEGSIVKIGRASCRERV